MVNDFAHVLDAATIDRMTRVAEDVRNKSRGEIAVVTLSDIGQNAAADVAEDAEAFAAGAASFAGGADCDGLQARIVIARTAAALELLKFAMVS